MAAPQIDQWNPENGIMPTEAENAAADAVASEQLSEQISTMGIDTNSNIGDNNEEVVTEADISLMRKILKTKLLQPKNDITIERADPNSPLYSVKSFEELRLPEELLKGLYSMGFQAPSKIQETALPILLANPPQNMIAQSQSGTGKTAAFLLSSLYRVDTSQNYPQVLILSPTYELAIQTGEVARTMAKFKTDLSFIYAVRGTEVARGQTIKEHVILGTPGKVMDWALKYRFFDPKKIKVFVLDEADVMIDTQGHRDQSLRIHKSLSPSCQLMFFSATFDTPVMQFAECIAPNAIIIKLEREKESLDNIQQFYIQCYNDQEKYRALANLFGTISMGQAFIFCATKKSASWLAEKLRRDGHAVGLISGDLTVEERTAVLQRFRDGNERVLIATNLMARGIDVDQVTVVINYDLPVNNDTKEIDYETYLHRIGRTGRFGKFGLAINFVDSTRTLNMIGLIENKWGKKIKPLDKDDVDTMERLNQD